MFFFATTLFFALWCLRLLAVNDRLRKTSPWDRAWQRFERQNLKGPRSLP